MADDAEPGFDTSVPSSSGGGASPFVGGSIDDMLKSATPDYGVDTKKATADLAEVQRQKNAATDATTGALLSDIAKDKALVRSKFEGIGPASDIKDWNADKERADRIRTPLENFGSMGSVFAILASSFTRTPMTNALNGAAAFMTAAKDNDEKNYDSAFEAFKKNSDLALKRHEIQRNAYLDATSLMKTDMAAGEAAAKAVAARFDDKKALSLLDNGYVDKFIEMEDKRAQSARGLISVIPKIQEMALERELYNSDPRSKSDDPAVRRAAIQDLKNGNLAPAQDIYQQAVRENPNMTVNEKLDLKNDLAGKNDIDTQVWDQYKEEHPNATAEEMLAFRKQLKDAGKSGSTNTGTAAREEIRNAFVDDWRKKPENAEWVAANPDKRAPADILTAANAAGYRREVTANKAADITDHINLLKQNLEVIDRVEETLKTHVAAAGMAGKVLRGTERIADVLGSDESDRAQMQSDIEYLRLNGARLLTGAKGRPIAAEADRINTIIRGLNWGDVTVNSLRSMDELFKIYAKSAEEAGKLLPGASMSGGSAAPSPTTPRPSSTTKPAGRSWRDDPVVSP